MKLDKVINCVDSLVYRWSCRRVTRPGGVRQAIRYTRSQSQSQGIVSTGLVFKYEYNQLTFDDDYFFLPRGIDEHLQDSFEGIKDEGSDE